MMPWAEYLDWVQYFTERAQDQARAVSRARGEIRTDDPQAVAALLKASGAARKPRTIKAPPLLEAPPHG